MSKLIAPIYLMMPAASLLVSLVNLSNYEKRLESVVQLLLSLHGKDQMSSFSTLMGVRTSFDSNCRLNLYISTTLSSSDWKVTENTAISTNTKFLTDVIIVNLLPARKNTRHLFYDEPNTSDKFFSMEYDQ
jgi:hypothetical protein